MSWYTRIITVLLCSIILAAICADFLASDTSQHANEQFINTANAPLAYRTQVLHYTVAGQEISKTVDWYEHKDELLYLVEDMIPLYRYPGWRDTMIISDASLVRADNRRFYLGTDAFGRSLYSRILYGLRISLIVGLISVIVSAVVGLIMGLLAGLGGRWVDEIVMFLVNSVWSIPTLLLVFVVLIAVGRGLWNVIFAIGITMWVEVARVVRGQILSLKQENFVAFAKMSGISTWRTVRYHILPNILGPLLVILTANFAMAILLEAGLSFLGFGVQPPAPSLGNILSENYGLALSGRVGIALVPALIIMLLVFCINVIGNHLRDVNDVRY